MMITTPPNTSKVTFTLEVAAQKLISQYMLTNESIQDELEAGIKKAFDNFDFEAVVAESVTTAINQAIRQSIDWNKMRTAIRDKADVIIDKYIESAVDRFYTDLHLKTK